MAKHVKPVPDGYHTITPYLAVRGGAKAIDFYVRALGAEEAFRMPDPAGNVLHAELRLGDSVLMLSDESPANGSPSPASLGGTPVSVFLYVEDVDALHRRAVAAGAKERMAPADMFWGDRMSKVEDPFGHVFTIATHKEDVSPEELGRRAQAAFSGGCGG